MNDNDVDDEEIYILLVLGGYTIALRHILYYMPDQAQILQAYLCQENA